MSKYEVYSKDNELLWIVDTEEDAKRLCQGTHHYIKVEISTSYEDHLGNVDEVLAFNAACQKMRIEKMQEKIGMRNWTTGRSVEHVLKEITDQNRKISNLYLDYLKNIYDEQTKTNLKSHMSKHFIHVSNFAFFGWCKTQ